MFSCVFQKNLFQRVWKSFLSRFWPFCPSGKGRGVIFKAETSRDTPAKAAGQFSKLNLADIDKVKIVRQFLKPNKNRPVNSECTE